MHCPKCHAPMHTYNRNGVQIEQCGGCRGIFLDYGELEALTRLESQWSQQPPRQRPVHRHRRRAAGQRGRRLGGDLLGPGRP
ncbi:TFIIB-type zinc ribbon-containing protein, partial [Streptomyces albidoflavus]|uniref:TFIIB-type zinc ribbon-containing protein n=1 Tax=Streptomyces albidoflavus TaxID=1886 RepID=UPI0038D20033